MLATTLVAAMTVSLGGCAQLAASTVQNLSTATPQQATTLSEAIQLADLATKGVKLYVDTPGRTAAQLNKIEQLNDTVHTALESLKAAKIGDQTVEEAIAALSAKIGEKLELRRVEYFDGNVETYLHKRAADLPPAVGVLVEFEGEGNDAAHSVALQIAALKAKYLTRDEVPADVVESERRIAEETAKAEGKPDASLPKIVEGRLTGFYKDVVLLDQPSVSDSKKSVKALLDEAGVTVTRFVRFEVGQA